MIDDGDDSLSLFFLHFTSTILFGSSLFLSCRGHAAATTSAVVFFFATEKRLLHFLLLADDIRHSSKQAIEQRFSILCLELVVLGLVLLQ